MRHQIQTKPEGRRQPWIDAEVFDGTEAEAVALIKVRSAENGRPWRCHEIPEQVAMLTDPMIAQ